VTPDREALIDKARAAEAMLLGRGLSFSKPSGVMAAFGREFVGTGAVPSEFHRWLLDAFDARNIGDYDIHRRLTSEQAAGHVRRARSCVDQRGRSTPSPVFRRMRYNLPWPPVRTGG
jgi:hypothetical protein